MSDWPAEWFDEIDSTNEEARRRTLRGNLSETWIVARQQTVGRGRLGRQWKSPIGNLYATAYFQLSGDMAVATRIPFVCALAVSDVFMSLAPESTVQLKWPNDVRSDGAKLSGILVEAGQSGDGCWVAAGMGLNISEAPQVAEQQTSCLAKLRGDNAVDAQMAFETLRERFSVRLAQGLDNFKDTLADWSARAEGLGGQAEITVGNEKLRGVFVGLGTAGEFRLELPNGDVRCISAGDVELIRESAD